MCTAETRRVKTIFVSSCALLFLYFASVTSSDAIGQCGSTQGISDLQCSAGRVAESKQVCSLYHETPTLEWRPLPDRYLLMGCQQGRESNRAFCFQFSMYLAGILNRTLLFVEDPVSNGKKIDRHIFFDHQHTRACYGPYSVLTVAEYIQKHGHPPVIDQIRFLIKPHRRVMLTSDDDGGDPVVIRSIHSSMGNDVLLKPGVQVESATLPRRGKYIPTEYIVQEYGNCTSNVLFMGDGYFLRQRVEVRNGAMDRSILPFKRLPTCPNGIDLLPHPAIFVVADLVIQNTPMLQEKFIALHMRMGDFNTYHSKTYHTPTQYGEDVSKVLQATGLRSVFLVTDGTRAEVEEFSSAISRGGSNLVYRTSWVDTPWTSYLQSQGLAISPSIIINTEKVVAVRSTILLQSLGSTFSADIQRLRYGFNRTSCFDHLVFDKFWV